MPLLMAYKSSHGKIYYLPIKREQHKWFICLPTGNNPVSFRHMQDLIDHYYTYGFIDQNNKKVDLFRLKMLENSASD